MKLTRRLQIGTAGAALLLASCGGGEPAAVASTQAITADEAIEVYEAYVGDFNNFFSQTIVGTLTVEDVDAVYQHLDPAFVDGSVEDAAETVQACLASNAAGSGVDPGIEITHDQFTQIQVDDATWLLTIELSTAVEGEVVGVAQDSFLVTANGVGPSIQPPIGPPECSVPNSELADDLITRARELFG